MGYSLSWAAVKNGEPESVHACLGVRPTGVFEEIAESAVNGALLPSGWYLVLFNRKELGDATLKQLSLLGEVVHCFVEDHVMFSSASGWSHGRLVWSVVHNCEKGRYHLETKGVVPASLKTIHERLRTAQYTEGGEESDVDYIYDVPAELAKDLTGFRHDQDATGMAEKPFEVLEKKTLLDRFIRGKY